MKLINITNNTKTKLVYLQNLITTHIACLGFKKNSKVKMKRYGTNYGGYWLPDVFACQQGTLISVGLGRDISFDLELLNLGYEVIGSDPDTRFSSEILSKTSGRDFKLFEKMLVAYANNESQTDLGSLCAQSSKKSPLLLKCDIEGTELEVIDTLPQLEFNFNWLAFELDYLSCLKFNQILVGQIRFELITNRL